MSEQSRRKFLKSAAYASALTVGSLSGLSLAQAASPQQDNLNSAVSTVTLLNQSKQSVTLDAVQPLSVEQVHGWVVLKLNKTQQPGILLAAGQHRSFSVDAELALSLKDPASHIVITNEHNALDHMVPMATYDVVVV